jgi:subtilase family serine protease
MKNVLRLVVVLALAVLIQYPLSAWAAAKADLVVSNINHSPGSPKAGDEVTLWVFVKNQGQAAAGAFGVRVKVGGESNPPVISVPGLNPGQEFTYTKKVTFNNPGSYIVTITADAGNTVVESVEGNNVGTRTIQVSPSPKPDLIVSKINYSPANAKQHQPVTVWYFVKNVGPGKAEGCYLSTTSSMNNYSIWHRERVPALDPGQEWRYEAPWVSNAAGTFYLRAIIDRENTIAETNEGNNTLDWKIVVSP